LLVLGLIPNFVRARGGSGPAQVGVDVLDHKHVGIYETATISSQDPNALVEWLNANGFAAPTNITPVVAEYVKEGWVFVAAKISRENGLKEATAPHPLSFTFKTAQPVYPLRLTGIDNDSCRIDLYVFGPDRAEIPKFEVRRCSRVSYHRQSQGVVASTEKSDLQKNVPLSLIDMAAGAPVATKLSGKLSSTDMKTDARISWKPFRSEGDFFYSYEGAKTQSVNIFVPAAVLALSFGRLMVKRFSLRVLPAIITYLCALGLSTAGAVSYYSSQPKMEVRLVHGTMWCIANLKQIDGAVQQWALEHKKSPTDTVTTTDVLEYLKGSVIPACPADGTYSVMTVYDAPTCSVHGDPLNGPLSGVSLNVSAP